MKKFFFAFFVFFSGFIPQVLAQTDIDDGTLKIGDLELFAFIPTTVFNLREYGLLSLIGYLAVFFVFYLLLLFLVTVIKAAFEFSRDEASDIKDSFLSTQKLLTGVGYVFTFLIGYAIIGIFIGTGNLFEWPNKLLQCGDGDILFRAEYKAGILNNDMFQDNVLIYCCNDFNNIVGMDSEKKEFKVEVSEFLDEKGVIKKRVTVDPNNPNAVAIGLKDEGGWLFVSDPGGVEKNYTPNGVTTSNSCVALHSSSSKKNDRVSPTPIPRVLNCSLYNSDRRGCNLEGCNWTGTSCENPI